MLGFRIGALAHPRMTHDICIDAARVDNGHADIMLNHFMAQGFGKAEDTIFSCIISALRWHTDKAENRRYIGYMAATAFQEMRQESLRAINHTPEINIHNPIEIIHGHFSNGR